VDMKTAGGPNTVGSSGDPQTNRARWT
jgi:hypothetical protein